MAWSEKFGSLKPSNRHNCNKDAATVARAWSQVMRDFPDSTLITPATAGDGRTWFREWFGNCTAMYGPSGCNVTVMAVHSYICDASRLHSYLEEVHHEFGLPIWLTEFACGDHHDNRPLSEQLAFMREVLPILDASHIVERYAWMAARQGDPAQDARGLLVPGKPELTELGKKMAELPLNLMHQEEDDPSHLPDMLFTAIATAVQVRSGHHSQHLGNILVQLAPEVGTLHQTQASPCEAARIEATS